MLVLSQCVRVARTRASRATGSLSVRGAAMLTGVADQGITTGSNYDGPACDGTAILNRVHSVAFAPS